MTKNRYLERLVCVHYIERPSGLEEITHSRRERVRLTKEGNAKNDELVRLLRSNEPIGKSLATVVLGTIGLIVTTIILALGAARVVDQSNFMLTLAGTATALVGVMVLWFLGMIRVTAAINRQWDLDRAPAIAQFVNQNQEFVEALRAVDRDKAQTVEELSLLHPSRVFA